MNCNELHAHPRDGRLSFEPESHTYTVDGRIFLSVTTIVGDMFEKFDADYWATKKATAKRPAEVIKAEWEERAQLARDLGTEMHRRIEQYYLGMNTEAWLTDSTFRHFCAFTWEHRLCPYRTEWAVFIEEHSIAGTIDFLADNGDGTVDLWDWKRSVKVVSPAGELLDYNRRGATGYAPIDHIPDTAYHHYALQLSVYRYILETKYGIKVRRSRLGVFHPELTKYQVVELPYLCDEAKAILDESTRRISKDA